MTETILYPQYQAQLDIALMCNQITSEEYYEELLRQLAVDIETRGSSRFVSFS